MPTITFPYHTAVNPPGPFASITVESADRSIGVADCPAQIDSAADWTVIPQRLANQLQLSPIRQIAIQGFAGAVTYCSVYLVNVTLPLFKTIQIEVVAHADENWILLGRTVLNQFKIVLDGPSRKVHIEEP